MSGIIPSVLAFENTTISIIDRNGFPWVAAADLARALGYASEDAVSRIYRRNAGEFSDDMSGTVNLTVSGNLQRESRIFSPRGCHLVAMFSRTARAKAFRRWVLDVLDKLTAPEAGRALPDLLMFDGAPVTVFDRDGLPWLRGCDVGRALGFAQPDLAVAHLAGQCRDLFGADAERFVMDAEAFSPAACAVIAEIAGTYRSRAFRLWLRDNFGVEAPCLGTAALAATVPAPMSEMEAVFLRGFRRLVEKSLHERGTRFGPDVMSVIGGMFQFREARG